MFCLILQQYCLILLSQCLCHSLCRNLNLHDVASCQIVLFKLVSVAEQTFLICPVAKAFSNQNKNYKQF